MNAITEAPLRREAQNRSRGARPRQPLRRALKLALAVLLLLAALLIGNWWLVEGRWIQSTDDAYVRGDIAVLGARIEGDVAAIPVADNQPVHAGDPLIILDPRDWRARLAQASGAEAEAAAAVTTAARQVIQQKAAIDAAHAAVAQARAQQALAAADAGRAADLVRTGAVSRQTNDQAIAGQRKAVAATASAEAQLAAATQKLAVLTAQVAQAQARQQSAAAGVSLAENNLADTVIRAPFDGIAANRAAQLGQHVQAGALLIAVAPTQNHLFVTANFKETQLARMRPGMKVRVVADIDPDHPIDGRIDSIAPATGALFSLLPPENATGNFTRVVQRVPVKITLDPAQADRAAWLRPGLSITAGVDTRGPDAVRLGLWGTAEATLAHLF